MKRVLIVEDNAINRELMDYLLRAHGYETLTAVDGRAGIEIARRARPELILCDIHMPDVDGYEFARQAKGDPALRTIPLVAVTAYAMVGDRERILACGFDGYVSKPIDAASFVATLRQLVPPQDDLTSSVAPTPPRQAAPPRIPIATILVIDDKDVNLELKRDLLGPHGYEVLTAERAADGLRIARERLPALIISDVGMPDGNGFDLIRQVKADPRLAPIPFLFVTSTHWDLASETLGLQLGAARYLRRPIEPDVLLAEVRACLAEAGIGNAGATPES